MEVDSRSLFGLVMLAKSAKCKFVEYFIDVFG